MVMALFTVGHSTLLAPDFLKMLDGRVSTIVDVRSHPASRWEQYRKENLELWLPESGIKYEWWPELGGWDTRHLPLADEMQKHGVDLPVYAKGKFPKQRIGKTFFPDPVDTQQNLPIVRPYWQNQGLWDYSWYMTLDEFRRGVDTLVERGEKENIGFMCCEVLWWKCHRSMIADYLASKDVECYHLQPKLTLHQKALGNRLERYEPEIRNTWQTWRDQ